MPTSNAKSAPKPLSRKEREREARRLEIVRAARTVFAEKGFEKATLEEIAERAEYGKGTVYNYFDSKESLFLAATVDLLDEVRAIAEAAEREHKTLRESFEAYTRQMIHYYERNFTFSRMVLRVWGRPEVGESQDLLDVLKDNVHAAAEPLARLLKAAMRRKEIRRADPHILAMMFIGVVHHYFIHHHRVEHASGKSAKIHDADIDLIVSVFFDGIAIR